MTAYNFFGNNSVDQNANGTIPLTSAAVASANSFLSFLSASNVETFEHLIIGSRPSPLFNILLFGSRAELTQADPMLGVVQEERDPGGVFQGRFNVTPADQVGFEANPLQFGELVPAGRWWQSKGEFKIKFNTLISSFGFYGTDFGDFGGTVKLDIRDSVNLIDVALGLEVGPDASGQNGSLLFFGYINDDQPFDTITFKVVQAAGTLPGFEKFIGIDQIITGTLRSKATPYNGIGNYSNAPTSCITACPPEDVSSAFINVPDGFVGRWSAWSCQAVSNRVAFELYTGLNGTGTRLTTGLLKVGLSDAFLQTSIYFSGVAKSVVIINFNSIPFANNLFFDHMEFGIPPELPDAPIITFNWEINSNIQTSQNAVYEGLKFGMGFEELFPGPNAVENTYPPVLVNSFYNSYYPGTQFVNATAVRSKSTGGTGSFNVRHLDSAAGAVISLGNAAVTVTPGQTRIILNTPDTFRKSAFSFYYASSSPVIVQYYGALNAQDTFGGTGYSFRQTLPATGTCSLPDTDNVYCAWKACRFEFDSYYRSITISSADANALFDNITVGYHLPITGTLPQVDNTVEQHYNGGADSLGVVGPLVPSGPPYPHAYGIEFPGRWFRSYHKYGPELANGFYAPGYFDTETVSNYGFTTLFNEATTKKYINVIDGFTQVVSFFLHAGTFSGIYSGLNGTGTLLQAISTRSFIGGFIEYTFYGWARSIAFTEDLTVVDGLRFGYYNTNPVLPYFPMTVNNIFDSGILTGGNPIRTRMYMTVTPDGKIYRSSDNTVNVTGDTPGLYSNHWLRTPKEYTNTGSIIQFSFDGLTDGQTEFVNQGTFGGLWSSNSSAVAGSTAISKWGTSSLHVTPSSDEPAIDMIWPEAFTVLSISGGADSGTIECWVNPSYGTSSPYGRSLIMGWVFGGAAKGAEWNKFQATNNSSSAAAVYIFGKPHTVVGQIVLECFVGQYLVGSTIVTEGSFYHVAATIAVTTQSYYSVSFFAQGLHIADSPVLNETFSLGEARIIVGQADKLGTFNYYVNDFRVTRGSRLYNEFLPTYVQPGRLTANSSQIKFEGQNFKIIARLMSQGASDVVGTVTPTLYNGVALSVAHKLDVPRTFSVEMPLEARAALKFDILDLDDNLVATSHPYGAKSLTSNQNVYSFTGCSIFDHNVGTMISQGSLEFFYTESNSINNIITTRIEGWRSESFEGYATGAALPLTIFYPTRNGRLTCTVTGSGTIASSSSTGQSNTTYNGKKWLSLSGPTTFNFSEPITTFGFSATDIGDGGGYVKLLLTDTTNKVKEIVVQHLLTRSTGSKCFIGFHHPGSQYVSVQIGNTTTFGDMGIDDLKIGTREMVSQAILTCRDNFTSTGELSSSVPSNGYSWLEYPAYSNSLANLELTGSGTLRVKTSSMGPTRYGALLSTITPPDVLLHAVFKLGTAINGVECGIIARKNDAGEYYHLTYELYPIGTLLNPRAADNTSSVMMVTLTHQPSGEILFGPTEHAINISITGVIRYNIVGNSHTIYISDFLYTDELTFPGSIDTTSIATIYDDRILTGGQHGFTIKQPTAAVSTSLDQFSIYQHSPPVIADPITYTFGEQQGVIGGKALSAYNGFVTTLAAYGTIPFSSNVGLSAPLTVTALGASGLSLGIADTNNSSTVAAGNILSSTAATVTFTPAYSPSLVSFFGEGGVLVSGVPDPAAPPALARASFMKALGSFYVAPTTANFESTSVGATTSSLSFNNSSSTSSNGIKTTCAVTGGTISNATTGGRKNTSSGDTKYLVGTSGTDVVFTFSIGISAFGFYATDVGDIEGALTLYMLPDDGGPEESVLVKNTAGSDGNIIFFGFVNKSKRYTRVRFSCATPIDSYGIDNVIAADNAFILDPVPVKSFGLYLQNCGKQVGTTYSARIVTTTTTYSYAIPISSGQVAGGQAFFGFQLNGAQELLSVAITNSAPTLDAPDYANVIFGAPYYS